MLKNLRRRGAFALVVSNVVVALAAAAALQAAQAQTQAQTHTQTRPQAQTPPERPAAALQACFVYVSPVGQAGWTYQHELGRREMEAQFHGQVRSRMVEAVPEGPDAERVMRDMAASGCGLIFATSFGYLEPALKVAAEFPQVKFEHAGGWKTAPNLATYNARHYESRWLAGWLAGKTSRKGLAGYIAGFPVPEVVQGLNAFTLGMRAANPQAQVKVLWLNTWFDPPKEGEAALALKAQGVDVLTHHTASSAVAQAAEAAGLDFIAYHSDMRGFAPRAQLAAATHHWGAYYTRRAQQWLQGRWQPRSSWDGMAQGMVALGNLRDDVPAALRAALELERQALVSGRRQPFAAPLRDQAGALRLAQGQLSDEAIASMDWLVQGVQGGMPAR